MLDWSEIVLRLGAATVIGGAVGLNRDLHGKPVGVRTLGLVALATAVVVLFASAGVEPGKFTDAESRVMQGILTGIGFLGAGVIFHTAGQSKVHGLTSAACVWFTACVGILCGAGQWRLIIVSVSIVFLLLVFGGPLEKFVHRVLSPHNPEPPPAG